MKSKKSSSDLSNKKRLSNRLIAFQKQLAHVSYDMCVIDNSLDLFYFTGLKLSAGLLLITPKKAALFVDGRYIQMVKERSFIPSYLDISGSVEAFCQKAAAKKIAFDSGRTSYDQFLRLKKRIRAKWIPAGAFFQTIRAIKDEYEILHMKKSAELCYKGFLFIRQQLKVGITEQEIAKRFEIFCLEKGADKLSFEPIIAFGPNSAMPHYRPQNVCLKAGDLVLIDIGVVLNNYHSDMTRVVFFKRQDPFLKKVYDVVVAAQKAALAQCRAGAVVSELDLAARSVMKGAKLERHFLHSLGHGIGLETHEYPRVKSQGPGSDVILQEGMVITVEPGLYFEKKGGIRYEDTVVVTKEGFDNFYSDISDKELIVQPSRGIR